MQIKKAKIIILMFVSLLLVQGLVSAVNIMAGENYTFSIDSGVTLIYTSCCNSSDLEGLNVYQEGNNITISTPFNFKPDNFTLVFFDNKSKEIVREVYYPGGNSGRYKTIYRNITNNVTNETKIIIVPENYTKYGDKNYTFNYTIANITMTGVEEPKVNIAVRFWRWIYKYLKYLVIWLKGG